MTLIRGHQPAVVDLFSGAGGFSLGFHAAGSRILAAVDVNEKAASTFQDNFTCLQPDAPPRVFGGETSGDITNIELEAIARPDEVDILVGGPPCQGFSLAGRAKLTHLHQSGMRSAGWKDDPRNKLYGRFMDAVETWLPKAVVMENVPGMLSVKGENVAQVAALDLEGIGYRVGYAVLNAAHYGVPQFRERLFLVGVRADLGLSPELPWVTHDVKIPSGYIHTIDLLENPQKSLQLNLLGPNYHLPIERRTSLIPASTVADALEDLPLLTEHLTGASRPPVRDFRVKRSYDRPASAPIAKLLRTNWPGFAPPYEIDDHVIRRTPRDYPIFARMKPGNTYPAAIKIAHELFAHALEELGDSAPVPGSEAFRILEKQYIPPYPVDRFLTKWQKLKPSEPSWTVTAHLSRDTYSHIHYDAAQARAISVREAARLQSFPDGFRFTGNMGDCFRQIGNAVPPLLSWAIAAKLLPLLGYPAHSPWPSEVLLPAD